jgi:hypothetical protein
MGAWPKPGMRLAKSTMLMPLASRGTRIWASCATSEGGSNLTPGLRQHSCGRSGGERNWKFIDCRKHPTHTTTHDEWQSRERASRHSQHPFSKCMHACVCTYVCIPACLHVCGSVHMSGKWGGRAKHAKGYLILGNRLQVIELRRRHSSLQQLSTGLIQQYASGEHKRVPLGVRKRRHGKHAWNVLVSLIVHEVFQ